MGAFLCLLSSLPGFLIQSALYVVLATSLLRMPLPPCSQATSSTPPSPSSTLSAPSSSSCPACTSSMFEASLLEIPLVVVEPTYEPQPPVMISCSIVFSINTLVHGF